jgi:hypothetical protein
MAARTPRSSARRSKTVHQAALYFKRFKSLVTLLLRIPNAAVEDHSSSTRRFERYGWKQSKKESFYSSNIETWR